MKYILLLSIVALLLTACTIQGPTTESQIKQSIDQANYCQVKEDCVDIGSKCPFGCYILVNKERADDIRQQVDSFTSACVYSCIAIDGYACIDNKCEIIPSTS